MKSSFGIVFSIKIAHTYYPGDCQDFDFIIPPKTQQVARNGRIITKDNQGILYALCERNENGSPRVPLTGAVLRFGLRLKNPFFSNFTRSDISSDSIAYYVNHPVPTLLANAVPMRLTGPLFAHPLSKATRPVTVTVNDSGDVTLDSRIITDPGDQGPFPLDLRKYDSGSFTLVEKYASSTVKTSYFMDPDLLSMNLFGIIEIRINNSFYTNPPVFTLQFTAKEELLKYYVVGKKYSSDDLNAIQVVDSGFTEQGRTQILFQRVKQDAFSPNDISPGLLTGENSHVVLFKSQSAVSRSDLPRKKIQLTKNSDVVIAQLPQPGSDQQGSDIIIQISKP